MITVIDNTTNLKSKSKSHLDLNSAVNQTIGDELKRIKKRIEAIDTDEDVEVTINGTKDNLEFHIKASDELKDKIQRIIHN